MEGGREQKGTSVWAAVVKEALVRLQETYGSEEEEEEEAEEGEEEAMHITIHPDMKHLY